MQPRIVLATVVTVVLTCVTTSGARATTSAGDYLEPPTVVAGADDPQLRAAEERARRTFPTFLERLRVRATTDLEFSVRVRFRDGDREESLWLTRIQDRDGVLSGVVDANPRVVLRVAVGHRRTFTAEDVSDWMIIEQTFTGEQRVGGFTLTVLAERERRGLVPQSPAYDPLI
jgi:uncharacterized protein YegJ (DUF2314 family)